MAKITGVITKSAEAKSIYEQLKSVVYSYVYSLWQKSVKEGVTEYREAGCSRGWMQQLETNVGPR